MKNGCGQLRRAAQRSSVRKMPVNFIAVRIVCTRQMSVVLAQIRTLKALVEQERDQRRTERQQYETAIAALRQAMDQRFQQMIGAFDVERRAADVRFQRIEAVLQELEVGPGATAFRLG